MVFTVFGLIVVIFS
jgi:hypothetical protein